MAPPPRLLSLPPLLLLLVFLLGSPSPGRAQSICAARTFSNNRRFALCNDLPVLGSTFHWTHDSASSNLRLAFSAAPGRSGGWVSWGINPEGARMVGTQALLAFRGASGSMDVATYNISSYVVAKSKIAYEVADLGSEYGSDGRITIFGTMKLPAGTTKVNQVWQVGPSVTDGAPDKHAFASANMAATGILDLVAGGSTSAGTYSRLRKKNTHGVVNVVSWGILLPAGAIIARYLKTVKSADPAWFYLHVLCQLSGYTVGVAGWGTGLKLGSQSKGVRHTIHRSIGIALFCLGTLQNARILTVLRQNPINPPNNALLYISWSYTDQVFALFLRPKPEHKYRIYWNAYHHSVGYAVIVLGIVNVFKGFSILQPDGKWKTAYVIVIAVLGATAVLLEVVTWIICLQRRSGGKTTPNAANGHRKVETVLPM